MKHVYKTQTIPTAIREKKRKEKKTAADCQRGFHRSSKLQHKHLRLQKIRLANAVRSSRALCAAARRCGFLRCGRHKYPSLTRWREEKTFKVWMRAAHHVEKIQRVPSAPATSRHLRCLRSICWKGGGAAAYEARRLLPAELAMTPPDVLWLFTAAPGLARGLCRSTLELLKLVGFHCYVQ